MKLEDGLELFYEGKWGHLDLAAAQEFVNDVPLTAARRNPHEEARLSVSRSEVETRLAIRLTPVGNVTIEGLENLHPTGYSVEYRMGNTHHAVTGTLFIYRKENPNITLSLGPSTQRMAKE